MLYNPLSSKTHNQSVIKFYWVYHSGVILSFFKPLVFQRWSSVSFFFNICSTLSPEWPFPKWINSLLNLLQLLSAVLSVENASWSMPHNLSPATLPCSWLSKLFRVLDHAPLYHISVPLHVLVLHLLCPVLFLLNIHLEALCKTPNSQG